VYVNQALSPVLVAQQSQSALNAALEAYHNPGGSPVGGLCTSAPATGASNAMKSSGRVYAVSDVSGEAGPGADWPSIGPQKTGAAG
jgi:hypothetical protein